MNVIQEYFIDIVRYKYIQYQGRARRKEYWMFTLFYSIIIITVDIISAIAAPDSPAGGAMDILSWLINLGLFLPSICLGVRRLHDTGRSGWWLLLSFTLIGIIPLLIFLCLDSQPGENQYGPNPKKA